MKLGKRERELKRELDRWNRICQARADAAGANVPRSEVQSSLANPKIIGGRFRPRWDYQANTARSIAAKNKGHKVA